MTIPFSAICNQRFGREQIIRHRDTGETGQSHQVTVESPCVIVLSVP